MLYMVNNMKGKKQAIGTIKGSDLLKKSRGIQRPSFRTQVYLTEKDRPRNKNWRDWLEDESEVDIDES